MCFEGFRYARLAVEEQEASIYSAIWTPTSYDSKLGDDKSDVYFVGNDEYSNMAVVELSECPSSDAPWMEEIGISRLSLAEMAASSAAELPTVLVVPLALCSESSRADNCSIVEKCLLLLQTLAVQVRGASDGTKRQICFWTRNTEASWVGDTEEGMNIAADEHSSLLGASIWGCLIGD